MAFRPFVLPNGTTALPVPIPGTQAVTLLVMFPVGSRFENAKLSGASHFVEHMLFKGTTKRPEAIDISRALDAVGAEYNAFTYKDYTGYYVKIAADKQELAFDLVSDMLFNSLFEAKEVEQEKGVIVEELRMYEDNPTMAVDLLFDRVMFGDQHPLGWDIGGTAETVRALSREELVNYYRTYYRPDNMVVVAAGAVTPARMRALTMKYFGVAPKAKEGKKKLTVFPKFVFSKKAIPLAERIQVSERTIDQSQVILGFPGLARTSPLRYAEAVLLNILGGGMSSRLFVEVREKRGLAYMVRAGSSGYRETGTVYVQAGLNPAKLGEAFTVIMRELERIAREPVGERELRDAKNNLLGHMTLAREDSSDQASWFANKWLLYGGIETYEEVMRRIKAVTAQEVLRLAKKLFQRDQLRMAVIGPMKHAEVLSLCKW